MTTRMLLPMALLLVTVLVTTSIAASIVVPDLAGMIYPTSAISQHVQFGDPTSPYPIAYEFVAPTTASAPCANARLCLELHISSVFEMDPFYLHRYDTNTPLVSATFEGYDASDILPLIPGSTDGESTSWWFQSNTTETSTSTGTATATSTISAPPVVDMMLRLRQRSQRLSARDQLLVQMRFELVDSRTVTSAIQVYSVYGSQRVTYTTRRVDANTIRVALSIVKNTEKQDVTSFDAYPMVATASIDTSNGGSMSGTSCDACGAFLDACQGIELCQNEVLPCLLSQLEAMAGTEANSATQSSNNGGSGLGGGMSSNGNSAAASSTSSSVSTGVGSTSLASSGFELGEATSLGSDSSGSTGSSTSTSPGSGATEHYSTSQIDLVGPLATCAASLPTTAWAPIRQALFCFARLKCTLGSVSLDGTTYPTILRMTTSGSQKFSTASTISGTNNVNLTIMLRDVRPSVNELRTFEYSASASYLGMFLRSFVLQQAAEVSALVEDDANDSSLLHISLAYSNALMLKSLEFNTAAGQVSMIENLPSEAVIEYPTSSSRPALDVILGELRELVSDSSAVSHSWLLAANCLSCSSQLFRCSSQAVTDNSCSYNAMTSSFGQCILQQLPPKLFKGLMQGTASKRRVATEISRCISATSSGTNGLDSILKASSSLACFAATRCPFGPIALVQDSSAVVLETTSYIQLLRLSPSSSAEVVSITITYNTGGFLIAITSPIYVVSSEDEIKDIISSALVSTGIEVSVRSSGPRNSRTEWTLEIIYRFVFLAGKFSAKAVVYGHSLGSDGMKQIVMEGGDDELRVVPRNRLKVFKQSEVESTSPQFTLPQDDKCRTCAPVMKRCQEDPVCSVFSRETLVPSLRAVDTTQAKTSLNANGQQMYEFDLVPTLQSALVDGCSSWNLLAVELLCLAEVECDLEYATSSISGSHVPTYLKMDSILTELQVRMYIDTEWTMTISKRQFVYKPSPSLTTSVVQAADDFLDWMKIKISDVVPGINIQHSGSWTVETTGAAVGSIEVYGQYDELMFRCLMANLTTIPSFAASSPGRILPAGINVTNWSLNLTSVDHKPQYSKLLDLLKFGATASDSTIIPSRKIIPATDPCRACEAATAMCQNDAECVRFSREKLVPLLRNGNGELDVSLLNQQGSARVSLPFGPKLYSLTSGALISLESWDILATELSCFATTQCDLEYDDVLVPTTKVHSPSYLSFDKQAITLCVHTYKDTEWSMDIYGTVMTYVPDASTSFSPYEAALAFKEWIEEKTTQDPYNFAFSGGEPIVVTMDGMASFNVSLVGPLNAFEMNSSLLPPILVPKLKPSATTSVSTAQVNVVPWDLSLRSVNYKPLYSKLLDLLEFGFVENTPSGTSAAPASSSEAPSDSQASASSGEAGFGSNTSTSSSEDPSSGASNSDDFKCDECITRLKNCRQDTTCASALINFTFELKTQMAFSTGQTFDATDLLLNSIFPAIATAEGRQKLFSLITCSNLHCVQKSCDIGKPGEVSTLEISAATCTFTANTALRVNIQFMQVLESYFYAENDDPAAFALFVENEVLGGYESSRVQVKATKESVSADKVSYTFVFDGLVSGTPPHFYPQDGTLFDSSSETSARFQFTASTQELLSVYTPWINWLNSADTSSVPSDSTIEPTLLGMLPVGDICRRCAAEIQRCLHDTECAAYSHNVLLPWLRSAPLPNEYTIDLTPLLTSLPASAFSTKESVHAFSAELLCLAITKCQTGYYEVSADGDYHPSTLNIDPMVVSVHLRTYADTQWSVSLNGDTFTYTPPETVTASINDAAPALKNWIESLGETNSLDIEVETGDYDEDAGAASFYAKFFGGYDVSSGRYTLLSPKLFPTFTVVGGTGNSPFAEVSLWKVSLSSSDQDPKFDKLIDLLEYGIAGTTIPSPTSTVASPAKMIPSPDPCQKCSSILATCRADEDCSSFSDQALIPLLDNASPTIQTKLLNDYGAAAFTVDLYPGLSTLDSSEYITPAAWNLVAAEFSCLAYDACDMEYTDVYDKLSMDTHKIMNLDVVSSSVQVKMLTFADTEWDMTIDGVVFSFVPDGPSIDDTAQQLHDWFKDLNSDASMPLEVEVIEQNVLIDYLIFTIRFFGSFDNDLYQYMMVNPAMIPSFLVVGGTSVDPDAFSPAEANVTLPSLAISSQFMKPQYSRLIDMLSNGIASSPSTPSTTPTQSMSSSDPCRDCQATTTLCRSNEDCWRSSQMTLVPLLRSTVMAMNVRPQGESGAARSSLNFSAVLYSLGSKTQDAFLTREGWDLFAEELSCFTASCDVEYSDVNSPLWGSHISTSLSIHEVSVFISVCTYMNTPSIPGTQWSMEVGSSELSYVPPTTFPSPGAAAIDFRDWIQQRLSESPRSLTVETQEPVINQAHYSVTFVVSISGWSTTYDRILAPPWLIPRFQVTGGTGGGGTTPRAEANVTLWEVEITSSNQKPQYSKLLFMLDLNENW